MDNRATPVAPRLSFRVDLIIVVTIFLLAMLLYAPSFGYPFVWYDADDVLRAIKYSASDLFSGVAGYQYYRPLIFTFWKLMLGAWGAAAAPMFHTYLIGSHVLNGVLLYALARDLIRSRSIGAAAGLIFMAYPFSYQAVTWAIAHQPPSLTFVLACVLIYARARLRPARGSPVTHHLPALVCLIAAMLIHESAFVGAGIVMLVEAYLVAARRVARPSLWPLAYIALTLGALIVYSSAARSNSNAETLQLLTAQYLLQALIYPLAMLMPHVCASAGCDAASLLIPASLLALAGLAALWRANRTWRLGLLGLLWFGLGVAPVWAGRDFVYVEYAPRLAYLAGAGAALALAAGIGSLASRRGRWLRAIAIALMVLQSAQFVAARQPLYDEAFRLMAQENQAMFEPREGSALFVNAVELFTYKESEFPLGWFGVLVSPWHNRLVTTRHLHAEPPADWIIDPAQAVVTANHTHLKVEFHGRAVTPDQMQAAAALANDVFRVDALAKGELHLFRIGAIRHQVDPPPGAAARWGEWLSLTRVYVETEANVPVLVLEWQIEGGVPPGWTVFVHVRDSAGQIAAQADGDPIGGLSPLSEWTAGTTLHDRRPLISAPDLPSGTYIVVTGLYDRVTLERATPAQASLPVTDDALVVGTFDIP